MRQIFLIEYVKCFKIWFENMLIVFQGQDPQLLQTMESNNAKLLLYYLYQL